MLGRTDSRLRMVVVLLVFALFATAAGVRLGYWQVVAADELAAEVLEDKAYARALVEAQVAPMLRADIIDRDREVLAKTASYDSLDAHPNLIDAADQEAIVETLSVLLDLGPDERSAYREALASGTRFARLSRKLSLDQSAIVARAINDGLLPGITLTPHPARIYPRPGGDPNATLASQIIGFVAGDGRGGSGVERYYDERLTSVDPGSVDIASIGGAPLDLRGVEPPPLQLTIDQKLQRQLEKELYHARSVNRADGASAIVMDPHTGAILAVAADPSYDANDFARVVAEEGMRQLGNPVVGDVYEPGSVMKIFTAAAALDAGVVKLNTRIQDRRVLRLNGEEIHNADKGTKGSLRVKDVIAESRNLATARIAARLAPGNHRKAARLLYGMWQTVGMTGPTGVDVSGEARGIWRDPQRWAAVDLANASFGQGVAVTLMQLARGYATFINGGHLVQPHVVVDGEAARTEPQRVLEARVARQAKDILRHVTGSVPRYAERTLIRGYDIGGKTGTAQIWDPGKWNKETRSKGDWKHCRFNHSFVGFVGGRRQEVLIAVRLQEPVPLECEQGTIPLRVESTELFRSVALAAIKHLEMKPLKDGSAGRPIIGTKAARALDPVRDREAQKQRQQAARREERSAAKADAAGAADAAADGNRAGTDRARKRARDTGGASTASDPS